MGAEIIYEIMLEALDFMRSSTILKQSGSTDSGIIRMPPMVYQGNSIRLKYYRRLQKNAQLIVAINKPNRNPYFIKNRLVN